MSVIRLLAKLSRNYLLATVYVSLWFDTSYAGSMIISSTARNVLSSAELPPLLSATATGSERFFAVGKMRGTAGSTGWECTATLVASNATPKSDQPALIITADHCARDASMIGSNDVVIDMPVSPNYFFIPAYFYDNVRDHYRYSINRIVYSSMKGADIGLLQLDVTYGELRSRGIKPAVLKNFETSDVDIDLVHIPEGFFLIIIYGIQFVHHSRLWLFSKATFRSGLSYRGFGQRHAPMTALAFLEALRGHLSLPRVATV